MKEQEVINNNDTFEMKGIITKNSVTLLQENIMAMNDLFGEKAEDIQNKALDIVQEAFNSKVQNLDEPIDEATKQKVFEKTKVLLDILDEDIKNDNSPETSYIKRGKKLLQGHIKKYVNGDMDILHKESDIAKWFITGFFNNFPLPKFMVDGKYVTDTAKYEEYMSKYPLLESYEDRLEYENKYMLPYLKAKENGTLTTEQEKQYKLETYEHLKRQKAITEKINNIPQNEETMQIYPFATSDKGFDDWKRDRFGGVRKNQIELEMKALEHGWSPDDFQMIHDVDSMMTNALLGDNVPKKERNKLKIIHQKFTNAYVTSPKDRQKLIESVKPFYDLPFEKVGKRKTTYEDVKKKETFFVPLKADDRKRHDLIESLEKYLKGLNTGHRFGAHKDTDEMRTLKNKTKEVINLLKNNRDKNIYEDERFANAFAELGQETNKYINKKRAKYERELRRKLINPDIDPNSKEGKKQEREFQNELKKFKPGSKMGQARYDAANELIKFCKETKTHFKNQNEYRTKWKEYTDKGYKLVRMDDLKYEAVRPYDNGVKEILNYYSKTPALIGEHRDLKMFVTFDSFDKACKPLECNGVSEEDFSLVAYASVLDGSKVDADFINGMYPTKDPDITPEDKARQCRTMYTVDLQNAHRSNSIDHYGEHVIRPARERAKDALENYKLGDKTELINIMAKGISEAAGECMHADYMVGRDKGWHVQSEILAKLVDFAKKDKEIYEAVTAKLSKEDMDFVNDTLKLKSIYDKCVDSERMLKNAAERNRPLDLATKKECINNIVRFDYIAHQHDNQRLKQQREHKAYRDFNDESSAKLQNVVIMEAMGQPLDYTRFDILVKTDMLKAECYKPIEELHLRLRTQNGTEKIEGIISKMSDGIPADKSEKEIISSLNVFGKAMEEHFLKEDVEANKKASLQNNAPQNGQQKETQINHTQPKLN